MAMHIPRAPGFASMLKEGARHYSGLEEAVIRNISAAKEFASTLSSAYGPNGMNKMVINHLEKLFVTNDAATIVRELEVEHPAVKIIVMASQMMEKEIGDGTNFVILMAGALLSEAEDLVRMGIKPTEVAEGYELALEKTQTFLEDLCCGEVKDIRNKVEVQKVIRAAIMSKQYGSEDFLSDLVTRACISILPKNVFAFNVDNVRVCKILGAGLMQSQIVQGMVFKRSAQTDIIKAEKCKVAVYTCPVDLSMTETKGTVLINTAQELSDYSRGEEEILEKQIKGIADSGAKVVVSGGKIGDLALHYLNKYNLMGVRLLSKWDIRRLCKALGATPLPKVEAPTAEELGYADHVYVDEIGETSVVVFRLDSNESPLATVVIRGATDNYLDDVERAIDDGVNTFKGLCRDPRYVAGAGACEIELSRQLTDFGEKCPGMEQYAVKRFADALSHIPKALAENSGAKGRHAIANLMAAHEKGDKSAAFDIDQDKNNLIDAVKSEIFDLFLLKQWGLEYAVDAAATILRIDQIIMAKKAGGPKARPDGPMDQDDD